MASISADDILPVKHVKLRNISNRNSDLFEQKQNHSFFYFLDKTIFYYQYTPEVFGEVHLLR